MSFVKNPKMSKITGAWSPTNESNILLDQKELDEPPPSIEIRGDGLMQQQEDDNIFTEVIVEDITLHKKSRRRFMYSKNSKDNSSESSLASSPCLSSSSDDEQTQLISSTAKVTKKIERNIKRIQRHPISHILIALKDVVSVTMSLPILLVLLAIAIFKTGKAHLLDLYVHKKVRPQESYELPIPDELLLSDETYYADRWGYTSQVHEVVTPDGYILKMRRIYKKGQNPQGRQPVLIGHGLFQCSGAFVLNEERSLAFELINQGYDVWLGNNRSIAGLEHIELSHEDPEYWNWGLKELGIYDFPTLVDYVRETSGFEKIAYIGHSQGNAQAFVGLSLVPHISEKLSCFVALAPAVFAGNLVHTFPLNLLISMNDWLYSIMFGNAAFLPIMSLAQTIVEPKLFCFLAYSMFSYLFTWWDSHWLRRRKAKYFQFTPRPVSTKLIADWIAGWGRKGVCMYIDNEDNQVSLVQEEEIFKNKVPLTVFYGTADYLVDGEKFVRTFPGYENFGSSQDNCEILFDLKKKSLFPMLDLIHVERIVDYEHMDTIWGHSNHETTYPILRKILKSAKW